MVQSPFRGAIEEIVGDFDLDGVKSSIEKLMASKKIDNLVENFLDYIDFKEAFGRHPLMWKAMDWGNAARRYRASGFYKKLQDKLVEILKKQKVDVEDLSEVRELLRRLKGVVIDFVEEQASKAEQGLRHYHAPGSVAKSEAINLYFGEKFTKEDLHKLALRLFNSIAFGDDLGIYSEDQKLMREMRQFIESYGLGPHFKMDGRKLREIGIQEGDTRRPYVVLLKFILWLRKQIDVEENLERKNMCLSILNGLRSATISILFMPGRDKEKWCTISIPRLDFFINNWVQRDKARKLLEVLIDNVANLINAALVEARRTGEEEKARNVIDLLMNNFEILCRKLIEYGLPDFYALRNMMDVAIDLSSRYDIKLHFKSLTLTV